MEIEAIEQLLHGTKTILKHQKEIEKLKGETFNVFSILKMERLETKTHTPFLAELLNPDGNHLKGNIFLQLFLETIEYYKLEGIEHLNYDTAKIKMNHSIGTVITKDGKESGGSLDIFIIDKNKCSITIENKIDENTEQTKQVVRYHNYNQEKNTVYYLTPFGKEPSFKSRGDLENNADYYIISYKIHIIAWLKKCLKESTEQPILRETIKQYLILIQKITFSMDNNKSQLEINNLIIKHFDEALYISNNFTSLKKQIGEEVRNDIIELLKEKLGDVFNIIPGNNSQIWFRYKNHDKSNLFFGIEYFCENSENLKFGVFNQGGNPTFYEFGEKSKKPWWPYFTRITDFEEFTMNFGNSKTLQKLYNDIEFKKRFELHILSEIEKFLNIHKESLLCFLENSNNGQNV